MCKWLKDFWKHNQVYFKKQYTLTLRGRFVLYILRHPKLFWWFLKFVKYGKFKTPEGIEYTGIKIQFKW